jgi:putative acetyltransferase
MTLSEDLQQVSIQPLVPEDQDEVKSLILAGLAEHWGDLDPSLNLDLNDLTRSYAGEVFLVARLRGKIVGTGALVGREGSVGEIVRMSVARPYRRLGIGCLILERLCQQARLRKYHRLVLETTDTWDEVIAFYLNFGFEITHNQDNDVYFKKELG